MRILQILNFFLTSFLFSFLPKFLATVLFFAALRYFMNGLIDPIKMALIYYVGFFWIPSLVEAFNMVAFSSLEIDDRNMDEDDKDEES